MAPYARGAIGSIMSNWRKGGPELWTIYYITSFLFSLFYLSLPSLFLSWTSRLFLLFANFLNTVFLYWLTRKLNMQKSLFLHTTLQYSFIFLLRVYINATQIWMCLLAKRLPESILLYAILPLTSISNLWFMHSSIPPVICRRALVLLTSFPTVYFQQSNGYVKNKFMEQRENTEFQRLKTNIKMNQSSPK